MKILHLIKFIAALSLLVCYGCTPSIENQLFHERAGTGETILFIHGAQEDYRVYMPQLDLLKEDYDVITYSRKYNYPNTNEYEDGVVYNTSTEAEDLEILIKSLNVAPVHLVGHSFGGLIAMNFTSKYPEKIQSLTLSEPPLLRLPGCEQWLQAAQKGLIENVGNAFQTNDTTLVMKAIFEFFVGMDIQDQVPPEVLKSLKANLSEMKALVNSEDPFPELNTEIRTPVMLITTENTMPMLDCTNKALVKKMPEAKHIHMPEASHDLWKTHPEILSTHIRDFASTVSQGNIK